MDYTRKSYEILDKIYRGGAYSTIALGQVSGEDSHLVTRIVKGVLERDTELEYIISRLVGRPAKNVLKLILKQGIFCLKYMSSLPDYAVINNHVELCKQLGKRQNAGFINATLKNAAAGKYALPEPSDGDLYLSVKYSKPLWFIEKLRADYGNEKAVEIISVKPSDRLHIRVNGLKLTKNDFENYIKRHNLEYSVSPAGGYYIKGGRLLDELFLQGKITYMSESSMYAVKALGIKPYSQVLDLCAAPGGKCVYAAELDTGGMVEAGDIYPHRVNLIKSYAKRMGVHNVDACVRDAAEAHKNFIGRFDYVLADVPCSGLGVFNRKPDVLLKKNADCADLTALQKKILFNAADYVKEGGILVYSTCTLSKRENEDVVAEFLKTRKDFCLSKADIPFVNDGIITIFPDNEGRTGFFIARFVKNGLSA